MSRYLTNSENLCQSFSDFQICSFKIVQKKTYPAMISEKILTCKTCQNVGLKNVVISFEVAGITLLLGKKIS